jgi:hypothetical protein
MARMLKKVLTWGSIAFVVFFIATQPKPAAQIVHSIFGGIGDVATGFVDFFSNLVA